jgi:DNA polymerase I
MKTLIIDGNNLVCASFFSLHDQATDDSTLYDFSKRIEFYVNLIKAEKVFVCWDSLLGSAWRKEAYPNYKANRKDKDENLISALNFCRENNHFKNVLIDKAEGDDTIYAICKVLSKEFNFEDIEIVSSDKDLIQCVQEKIAGKIINPIARETEIYREIPNYDIVEYKSIVGDSSDGIKGIPKKGPAFFENYLKHTVSLTAEEKTIKNLCERITRLSMNPSLQDNIDKVKKEIDL